MFNGEQTLNPDKNIQPNKQLPKVDDGFFKESQLVVV